MSGTMLSALQAIQTLGAAVVMMDRNPWDSELACSLYFYKQS